MKKKNWFVELKLFRVKKHEKALGLSEEFNEEEKAVKQFNIQSKRERKGTLRNNNAERVTERE